MSLCTFGESKPSTKISASISPHSRALTPSVFPRLSKLDASLFIILSRPNNHRIARGINGNLISNYRWKHLDIFKAILRQMTVN